MTVHTKPVPVNVALEFITMRTSHRGSSLFTGYPKFTQASPPTEAAQAEQPITTQYTPAQTMALLGLRKSELSLALPAKLEHSTARPSEDAKAELRGMYLAEIRRDGALHLTVLGHFKANQLAKALAEQLGVPIPAYTSAPHRHDGYRRRGAFQRGVMSQNGNW